MQIEPILSFHNVDHSPAVEDLVHRRIAMLEKRDDRITGCEVTLEAAQKKQRHGRAFRVRLNLHLPGPDLSISREIAQGSAQDDLILAVNRAFTAAEKALKKRKKVMGGVEVKHHPPILHGEIVELEPELGHGWLRADDGRRVYFQRDSLTSQDWDRLQKGMRLKFREMSGEKGPYAAAVTIVERALSPFPAFFAQKVFHAGHSDSVILARSPRQSVQVPDEDAVGLEEADLASVLQRVKRAGLGFRSRAAKRRYGALNSQERIIAFLVMATGLMPTEPLPDGRIVLKMEIERRDWADLTNTAVETISRTLRHLEEKGLITGLSPYRFHIHDLMRLAFIAGMGPPRAQKYETDQPGPRTSRCQTAKAREPMTAVNAARSSAISLTWDGTAWPSPAHDFG